MPGRPFRLKSAREVVPGDFAVPQDSRQKATSDCFAGMHRHGCRPAIGMPQKVVATSSSDYFEAEDLKRCDELLAGGTRQLCHLGERQALYPNEFEAFDLLPLHFQAELSSLPNTLHQLIERFRLGVAPGKLRNGGHVKTISIPLDDDVEFFFHQDQSDSDCTSRSSHQVVGARVSGGRLAHMLHTYEAGIMSHFEHELARHKPHACH